MEERLGQVHLLILGFCDTETCLPRCSAIRANMTSHVKRFPQYMKGTVSGCAFTDSRDLQTDSLSYFFFLCPVLLCKSMQTQTTFKIGPIEMDGS